MRKLFTSNNSRLVLVSAFALAGCQQIQPAGNYGTTQLVPAQPVVQAPAVVQPPYIPPPPPQLVKIDDPQPQDLTGLAATYAARTQSTQVPQLDGYVNSVMVYNYEPGEVYRVDTSPDYVTTIMLEQGEQLISKAAGDTERWLLGNTIVGSGASQQVMILLKPEAPNLHTNVVLTTTKRVYFLDVYSHDGDAYQNGISWNYPDEQLAQMEQQATAMNQSPSITNGPALSINDLNFSYAVKMVQGEKPEWYPEQVFDDGSKTYIRFPNNLGSTDAPPLFIVEQGDRADLVNYRVKDNYYIVDSVIDRAQLRLGETPQTIVEIDRTGSGPAPREADASDTSGASDQVVSDGIN